MSARRLGGVALAAAGFALMVFAAYGWAKNGSCVSSDHHQTKGPQCSGDTGVRMVAFVLAMFVIPAGFTQLKLRGHMSRAGTTAAFLAAVGFSLVAVPVLHHGAHPLCGVAGGVLIAIAVLTIALGARFGRREALERGGVPAHAMVLAARQPLASVENETTPRVVRLHVTPTSGEPFDWNGRPRFPSGRAANVGWELAVRVSPDRRRVVLNPHGSTR